MFHMHALITKEKYSKKNLYYLQFIWHSLVGQNMFVMLTPLPSPPLKKKQERRCLVSQDPKPSPK